MQLVWAKYVRAVSVTASCRVVSSIDLYTILEEYLTHRFVLLYFIVFNLHRKKEPDFAEVILPQPAATHNLLVTRAIYIFDITVC